MTSPQPNPRRCYKTRATPAFASSQPTPIHHHARPFHRAAESSTQPLRKSSTFHSPKSPSSDDDPILNIPLLSRRSPTCPKDLEDVVAASEQRIGQLIGSVDRSLSGLESFSTDSQETLRPDDLPVPRFILGTYHAATSDHMDVDDSIHRPSTPKLKARSTHNRHTSDSGLGSSVSSTEEPLSRQHASKRQLPFLLSTIATKTHIDTARQLDGAINNTASSTSEIRSGINGAIANVHTKTQHILSSYACKQIQDHIITPILKEGTLRAFHPLIKSIPHRVGRKEITCLRDLEKVVLWLAPVSGSHHVGERSLAHGLVSGVKRFSISRSSFVKFCERSIQCLHTTVEYLNDSDRQRPTDRPYTNGYFLDLTAQVRQYAAMITATRERIASGRAAREEDYSTYVCATVYGEIVILSVVSDERLSLHGGLGHTGRPAELVRIKNGQAISLRTGEIVRPDMDSSEKTRSSSSGPEDDLLHSMARRKKTEAERAKQIQRCSECDKEFKRPCDLTKHEKTHSRPWKCNEPSCKYSQYGWPTEKERDRHVNDKHSVTPSMFKCQFHPCPYESKRESNCKQHMEKAHGWAYVRSKNNGKNVKKPVKAGKTPPTPQMTTPGSHIFSASSSDFGEATSPFSTRESLSPYIRNSYVPATAPSSTAESSSNLESPALGVNDNFTPWNPSFQWEDSYNDLTPQTYTPSSHRLSVDSIPTIPSSYEMQNDPTLFGENYDWNNMDFTSLNIQLDTTTPLSSDAYTHNPSISLEQPQSSKNPNLSPSAQGNEMLYSPYGHEVIDEGYADFSTNAGKPATDFALFDDSRPTSGLGNGTMGLFSDLPPFQPTTWTGRGNDLTQQLGMNDAMQLEEE